MKKLVFMFVAAAALTIAACGGKNEAAKTEEVAKDTTVEAVVEDSAKTVASDTTKKDTTAAVAPVEEKKDTTAAEKK